MTGNEEGDQYFRRRKVFKIKKINNKIVEYFQIKETEVRLKGTVGYSKPHFNVIYPQKGRNPHCSRIVEKRCPYQPDIK